MTSPSSSPDSGWYARITEAAPRFLGQAALWLSLWFGLINFPQPPAAGLDPSWRMTLGYAVSHQLQHGADLVFTYGPLGYLLPATNSGGQYVHHLVWQLGINAIFATIIWLFGRSFRGWRLAVYYIYFLVLGINFGDTLHTSMILLLALALLREPIAVRRWLAGLVCLLLAMLALVKYTNFMLAGFAIGCICIHHLWRRRWLDAGLVAAVYTFSFLGGWILWDQHLANLPAFVINSFNAAMGYAEAMSVYETPTVFAMGFGGALCLGSYYLLSLWRRDDLPRAAAMMLIAAATSFMNWKHGYVRADGHVFAHYITSLLMVVSFPVLLDDNGPWPKIKVSLLAGAAAFCLAGAYIVSPNSLTDAPAIWNYHLKTVINALRIVPDFPRNSKAEYYAISGANSLPGIKNMVGKASIDMLGNEQSYILFSGLNYTPRPVFQSYFSYTGRLLRLNEEFYQSPRAPEYVAQRFDTIDYRLPALDDSLALRHIYRHYDFLLNDSGFLMWRRRDIGKSADDEATPLAPVTTRIGETVKVPEDGENPIWAEVEVRPSLLGKLRSFLYKSPIIALRVNDSQGHESSYRLIRQMAQTGFLAYPHFTAVHSIESFEQGNPPVRMVSLAVELPPEDRKYFADEIAVRFYALKPFPRSAPRDTPEIKASIFRMFDRVPNSTSALFPVGPLVESNHEVLSAHPPSVIEFNVDFPATRVQGRFGLTAKAYEPPNATDGVEFVVEWMGANSRGTKLFSRLLRPATVPADRGFQDFDVVLPAGGGRLYLRTNPGPNNDLSFDWSFWTDVKFVP